MWTYGLYLRLKTRRRNRVIIKKAEKIATPAQKVVPMPDTPKLKSFSEFKDAIGKRESSNNYSVENQYGYLGRYQFGLARLTDFGVCRRRMGTKGWGNKSFLWNSPFSKDLFLENKDLQDRVFTAHVRNYHMVIKRRYGMWVDKKIHGIDVTESGIIACFHLLGMGGFNDFLNGTVKTDANGTKATDYLTLFAGYNIPTDLEAVTTKSLVKLVRRSDQNV